MSHSAWLNTYTAIAVEGDANHEDVAVVCMPLFHGGGMHVLLQSTFLRGGTGVLMGKGFEPDKFLITVDKHKTTLTLLVPTQLAMLVNHRGARKYDVRSLEKIWYGSAPISPHVLEASIALFNVKFYQWYGQTETGMVVVLRPEDHKERSQCTGREVFNADVRLVDDEGKTTPVGEVTEYVSDPSKPVPNSPRPQWGYAYDVPVTVAQWRRWLVEDQRFVDGRPDVATWLSEPLTAPLSVRGPVKAKLAAETTGSDADWVVKLIDVYPDDAPGDLEMSGFQLMVSADIFRGRYRDSLEEARPLAPGAVLAYEIPLPHANHTFQPGHRLMVQVQSTWFPLYDRNPQTFVPSIMTAPPESYRAQKHRIHHGASHATFLELPLDTSAER